MDEVCEEGGKGKAKAKKIDILLIPGGLGAAMEGPTPPPSEGLQEFVKWATENVETVLSGECDLL